MRHLTFLPVLLAPLAGACGTSEGGAAPAHQSAATLAANAHAVQAKPTAMDDTSITFADNAESRRFAVNDVIASSAAEKPYYLRRITGVQAANGHITFQTQQGSLDDLLASADIEQVIPLFSAGGTGHAGSQSLNPLDAPVPFPNDGLSKVFNLPGEVGSIELGGGGHLDMTESYFKLAGGLDVAYHRKGGLDPLPSSMRIALQGALQAKVGANLNADGFLAYNTPELEWGAFPLGTIYIPAGPVLIPVEVELALTISASVEADVSTTVHDSATMTVTVHDGVEYANGAWSPIRDNNFSLTHDPLTVQADEPVPFNFTIYPSLVLNFKFYGVAGPFLEGHLAGGIGGKKDGASGRIQHTGTVGWGLAVGGDVTIMGHNLGEFDYELVSWDQEFGLDSTSCYSTNVGAHWCNLAALKACVDNGGGPGCVTQSQSGSGKNASICGDPSPPNQDVTCNIDTLLQCICEQGARAGGGAANDGGDCFSQHCGPCLPGSLVCAAPQ